MNESKNIFYSILIILLFSFGSFAGGYLYSNRTTSSKIDAERYKYTQLKQEHETAIKNTGNRIAELESKQSRSIEIIDGARGSIQEQSDIIGRNANEILNTLDEIRKQKQDL